MPATKHPLTHIVERCDGYSLTTTQWASNQVAGIQVDFCDEVNTFFPSGFVIYAKAGKNAVVLSYLYETIDTPLDGEVETALIAIVGRHSGLQNVITLDVANLAE